MKLYLVHCGYYDKEVAGGVFESHVNYMIAAESPQEARTTTKALEEFQRKRMHVDGLQEIEQVCGYSVRLVAGTDNQEATVIHSIRHRDLAPVANQSPLV